MPTENTFAEAPTTAEIIADELADIALDDPERAAQFVSAVTPGAPRSGLRAFADGSVAERAVPAAIVGVFLLQVLPKGRVKRLGLAVLGSALVAGLVAGKQQSQPG